MKNKETNNPGIIHFGTPLSWILKRSFEATFNFIQKNIKSTDIKKKKPDDFTCTVLANYCHVLYEHVVKEENKNINYNKIKRFCEKNWGCVSLIFKKRFRCNEELMKEVSIWVHHKESIGDTTYSHYSPPAGRGEMRIVPGDWRNKYAKNILH